MLGMLGTAWGFMKSNMTGMEILVLSVAAIWGLATIGHYASVGIWVAAPIDLLDPVIAIGGPILMAWWALS